MAVPMLATKLYVPPPRPRVVTRPRLIERLNEGLALGRRLTLISAPAGFGKTTLISDWLHQNHAIEPAPAGSDRPPPATATWLSLDEGDNDPARFLSYLVAALQKISARVGESVLGLLQAPQPPPVETVVTTLLNDLAAVPQPFVLVLDDYHVIDSQAVDQALALLGDRQPPHLHLVITTREDPRLPLARLRARGQLNELRAADLRFTADEAAEFLNRSMGLGLSAEEVAVLDQRTEGWIVGLQLAALSMHGQRDTAEFIQSFTGSHQFVLDYLVEEVLQQQPAAIQSFLLRTSILERLCGPLCEAVLPAPPGTGQATLEQIERANLFVVPLDNERRWYRYHHLFADLLRQRLRQASASGANGQPSVAELHIRASQWFEDNQLDLEAFHHAVAAEDVARATRLVEEKGLPLHNRGAMMPVLNWLGSLPRSVFEARPTLWVTHGSLLLVVGHREGVEEKLRAAEAALPDAPDDPRIRHITGQIASARATLALTRYDVQGMLTQGRRALEHLPPTAAVSRSTALWTMGYAHFLLGERGSARQEFGEAIRISRAAGRAFTVILASIGLGNVQELDLELPEAAETYRGVLKLAGDQPLQIVHEADLGLARVLYEWNDLDAAEQHGRRSLALARQYESGIDRFILCEVFLARLKLARGDVSGAASILAQAAQTAKESNFVFRQPEVAAAQVVVFLRQGGLAAAAQAAEAANQSLSRARVRLAQGDPAGALDLLETWRAQAETKGWPDERLKTLVLEALAHQARGSHTRAQHRLTEALTLAEPSGAIRVFVDEGAPMTQLLARLRAEPGRPPSAYLDKLWAASEAAAPGQPALAAGDEAETLIEPLSPRELDVLRLMADGFSNSDIGERLFLALSTVKGHNQRIFEKLQVRRRTEAVARARDLGLL